MPNGSTRELPQVPMSWTDPDGLALVPVAAPVQGAAQQLALARGASSCSDGRGDNFFAWGLSFDGFEDLEDGEGDVAEHPKLDFSGFEDLEGDDTEPATTAAEPADDFWDKQDAARCPQLVL